jgi:hypothetical protein
MRITTYILAIVAVAGLSGCMGLAAPRPGERVAEAPKLAVGERWVYRARDGFRAPDLWTETREVTAIGASGYTVHVSQRGPSIAVDRQETWPAPGLVDVGALMNAETRRFASPLLRYRFPLYPGEVWNQWVDNYNEATRKSGQINRYVRVSGWEKVTTPAGTFDAIRMRVLMQLDDADPWRWPTRCNYVIWYAPAVGAPVREERDAEYYERGDARDGPTPIRTQHALLELVSWSPGTP